MSEQVPETPKPVKHGNTKTTATTIETAEPTNIESQAAAVETRPSTSQSAAALIIHNRPSTWIIGSVIAVAIFLFGYVSGIAMSHARMMHHMPSHNQWQQNMRMDTPRGSRTQSSSVPSV